MALPQIDPRLHGLLHHGCLPLPHIDPRLCAWRGTTAWSRRELCVGLEYVLRRRIALRRSRGYGVVVRLHRWPSPIRCRPAGVEMVGRRRRGCGEIPQLAARIAGGRHLFPVGLLLAVLRCLALGVRALFGFFHRWGLVALRPGNDPHGLLDAVDQRLVLQGLVKEYGIVVQRRLVLGRELGEPPANLETIVLIQLDHACLFGLRDKCRALQLVDGVLLLLQEHLRSDVYLLCGRFGRVSVRLVEKIHWAQERAFDKPKLPFARFDGACSLLALACPRKLAACVSIAFASTG
eukprot:397473-Prymnesium_polylepis.1